MKNNLSDSSNITTAELQQRVCRVYDHLYANAEIKTPHGISKEVGKILHVAMYTEENDKKWPAFYFPEQNINILLSDDSFVKSIAYRVRQSFTEMNKAWEFYEKNENINLSDFDIAYTCFQLNGVVVSDPYRDVFGDVLEIFRIQWAKQMGGQFFTDSNVTMLAMHLLDFDPRKGDDLVDICAGTGGFLLAGLNHVRELLEAENHKHSVEKELVTLARRSLRGQEIDKEVTQIANATLESRLSKSNIPFVISGDSLSSGAFENNQLGLQEGKHLCVATNPPFGTKITVKDSRILKDFDLAQVSNGNSNRLSPRAPDILFLEKNIKMLKPGKGRLAIVLPYQILSGPQTLYIRNWLLVHTQLQAVIDLPPETFQPHTGTKASLVVVKRRNKPLGNLSELNEHQIFMSMPKWIGHDRRGNPVYKKTPDGRSTHEILTDFPNVMEAYKVFKQGKDPSAIHENSFVISSRELIKDEMHRINSLYHRPLKYQRIASRGFSGKTWKVVRLGDVVEKIFYPGRFKRNYVDYYLGAVPFFGGSDITQMINSTGKWLRHDDPHLEDLRVQAGWILITRSGSTGIVSSVPLAWGGFAVSEHVIRIIPDKQKLDPNYLQLFLRTKYCQEIISRGVFGSVIDEIAPEFISDIEIPAPKSPEVLKLILRDVVKAENHRHQAIATFFNALNRLNEEIQKV